VRAASRGAKRGAERTAGRVLLVDVGNTRMKWARFDWLRLGRQHAEAFAGWKTRDFERALFGSLKRVDRILVASVAGSGVNRMLAEAARHANGPKPEFVATQRRAGGIRTAYVEPWRLGVDRFAMAIGAHRLANGRAVCIISIGTALTIDLVDARGLHRGGAILPAPALMVDSLLAKTNGIRHRAGSRADRRRKSAGNEQFATPRRRGANGIFARSTRAAIEQGALLAAAAAVDRGADEAKRALGGSPLLILTGGGAKSVAPLVRRRYQAVPDLVLQGLAVLANEGRPPSRHS
jgi:type III pantothenate kinase